MGHERDSLFFPNSVECCVKDCVGSEEIQFHRPCAGLGYGPPIVDDAIVVVVVELAWGGCLKSEILYIGVQIKQKGFQICGSEWDQRIACGFEGIGNNSAPVVGDIIGEDFTAIVLRKERS